MIYQTPKRKDQPENNILLKMHTIGKNNVCKKRKFVVLICVNQVF